LPDSGDHSELGIKQDIGTVNLLYSFSAEPKVLPPYFLVPNGHCSGARVSRNESSKKKCWGKESKTLI